MLSSFSTFSKYMGMCWTEREKKKIKKGKRMNELKWEQKAESGSRIVVQPDDSVNLVGSLCGHLLSWVLDDGNNISKSLMGISWVKKKDWLNLLIILKWSQKNQRRERWLYWCAWLGEDESRMVCRLILGDFFF